MAEAPKKPAKPKTKTDKDQAERFKAAARQIGVDESGEAFEQAFTKIVPPKTKSPGS